MTQKEREDFILGKYFETSPNDWLPLISGWKNEDGSISIILNCLLQPGQKLKLKPKTKDAPATAPDYQCGAKRDWIVIEDGVVEVGGII